MINRSSCKGSAIKENSKQNLKDGSSLKGGGGRSKRSYSSAAALQAQVKNIRYHLRTVQSLTCLDKEGAFEKKKVDVTSVCESHA